MELILLGYLPALVAGLVGLAFGSFANVVIYRAPRKRELAGGIIRPSQSYCPECGHPIRFRDNIPVVSFVLLKGRCRSCGERIPWRYPLVEIASGALFAAAVCRFGPSVRAAVAAWFLWNLLVLAVIDGVGVPRDEYDDPYADQAEGRPGDREGDGGGDGEAREPQDRDASARAHVLPDKIVLPGIAAALAFVAAGELAARAGAGEHWLPLTPRAGAGLLANPVFASSIGFLAGAGLLLVLALVWRGGMGGGDIKLAGLMGLVLGPYVLLAEFLGAAMGAVVGVVLIASRKRGRKDMVPFGPFLALAAAITLFFGPALVDAYVAAVGIG